jgi:hypothetical protein
MRGETTTFEVTMQLTQEFTLQSRQLDSSIFNSKILKKRSNMLHNFPCLLGPIPMLFLPFSPLVVHAKTPREKLPILPNTNFLYFPMVDFNTEVEESPFASSVP